MVKVSLFVTLFFVLSGCAFTDLDLEMPANGLENPIIGGKDREIFITIPFADKTPSPKRCGMKKNGYNMDTADAICTTPPGTWLAKLLADELRASGFTLIESAAAKKDNALVINGTISKVFVEPIIGFWSGSLEADLEVSLVATTASGLKAERKFFSKGIKKGLFAATQTPYQTALKRATDQLLEDMVEAIFYLMNTYSNLDVNKSVYSNDEAAYP